MSDLTAWPFVARSDEQERFAAVLAGLGLGRDDGQGEASTVVIVEGLGGHGKSWLMKRFEEIARGEVHPTSSRRPRGRAPMVVSLAWENEGVSPSPRSGGPPPSIVLPKLYAAIVAEAGSGRLARRAIARAFSDFTAALRGVTDIGAASGNGPQDVNQALSASTSLARAGAAILGDATAPALGSVADQSVSILAGVIGEDGAKVRLADRIAAAVRPEETLVRTFASGLRQLSKRRPVVLLLDTCELIGASLQWLRGASMATGGNAAWVIAGRFEAASGGGGSHEAAGFRRDLPEERVRIIPMLPFDDETVKLLLATAETELAPADEIAAVSLTGGIPIAVYLVAKMLDGGRPIAEVLAPIDAKGDSTQLVRGLAERYLRHVRTDRELRVDEHRLYGLALLNDDNLDADILRALWGEEGSMDSRLDELSRRHDFVLTPTHRLHAEVRATIRSYLLGAPRRSDVRAANERARSALVERINRTGQELAYEDLLANEAWRDDVLALLWHSFWIDNGDGLALLAELLPGALFLRPAFARDMVGVGTFFVPTLTDNQRSELRGCAGMLSFGSFVDQWLALRRSAALKASGPLGRLLDDSARDDLDAATGLLRNGKSHHAPAAIRRAPPRDGLVALMAARRSPETQAQLEHLEQAARKLPADGPYAREVVRVAMDLRDALRSGAPGDLAARDRYLRAADVDAKLSSEADDADRLGHYAMFLADVPGAADSAEALFERSLAANPDTPDVLGSYAVFLKRTRADYDRAEEMYERALAADPSHAHNLGNYAILLADVRGDDDRTEEMYERALAADPIHANNLGNYANFLAKARRDSDRAQEMYERALAADPSHANNLTNYAVFLRSVRGDDDRAEEMYERALSADPSQMNNVRNYAAFLLGVRHDQDRAEEVYERAIAADPSHADNLGNYALFLQVRRDHDRAQEMYERALAANPGHANNLTNYARLAGLRGDYDHAETLHERALAADPKHVRNLHGYTRLLAGVRGDDDRAEDVLRRAIVATSGHPDVLGIYAVFLRQVRHDYDRARKVYERAIAADPSHADNLGNFAILLRDLGGDTDEAQEMHERAIAADPTHANNLSSYAVLLETLRDHDRAEEMYERAIAADANHAPSLILYGIFLHQVRGDSGRAEELCERAIAVDPSANNLGYYANLLRDVRDGRAEEIFERAIAANSRHANNLGNYSRLLLELRKDAKALELIERAFAEAREGHDPLRSELWLYLAAVGPTERRDDAMAALVELVDAGVRSEGWDFSRVLARAREEGNPRIDRLEELAARVSSES